MSTFEVKVIRINEVYDHPNADRLSIVKIGGYNCISAKVEVNGELTHRYVPGDLAVYIPEGAVLPEWLLKHLGFWNEDANKGTLNGSNGDRIKAVKLRGILSEGVLFGPVKTAGADKYLHTPGLPVGDEEEDNGYIIVNEGDELAEELGIVKYEPPVPIHMSGQIYGLHGKTIKYDIENYKKYPDVFQDGEEVIASEKLHGTFCGIGYWPNLNNYELSPREFGGNFFVFSKGLGAQGLVFKNNEANKNNIYVRTLNRLLANTNLSSLGNKTHPVFVLGEIFGPGIQDLHYGQKEPTFRVFDISTDYQFLNDVELGAWVEELGLTRVPVMYRGPFSTEKMEELKEGKSTFDNKQIREGIVIKPVIERETDELGRVILKFVSDAYLTRKGGSEYN